MSPFQKFIQRSVSFIIDILYQLVQHHVFKIHPAHAPKTITSPDSQRFVNHRALNKPKAPPSPIQEDQNISPSSSPKSVRFFSEVKVMLVPNKQEYEAAGLADALWCQPYEYAKFKQDAATEVRRFIQEQKYKGNIITGPKAVKILFQPEDVQMSEINSRPSSALSGTFSH